MRRVALFLFILCLSMVPHARATGAPSAADIKRQIEESLQWRLGMAKMVGVGLATEAAVEVTPNGDAYDVKLSGLSAVLGPQQGKLDIGTVTGKVTPQGPDVWAVEITLPSTMTLYDKNNLPAANITLGAQEFSGTWHPSLEIFSRLDALYRNIQLQGVGAKDQEIPRTAIDSFRVAMDLTKSGESTWSGTYALDAGGIKVAFSGENAANLEITRISAQNAYDRMNMAQTAELNRDLREFFKSGKTPTTEESRAMLNSFMQKSQHALNGIKSAIEVTTLALNRLDTKQGLTSKVFSFDKLTLEGAATNVLQDQSSATLKIAINGLKTAAPPANVAGLVPDVLNIDATFDNLPLKQLTEAFSEIVKKSAAAPEIGPNPAQNEILMLSLSLPQMLQDNKASLTLKDTYIKSADLGAGLTGKVEASRTSLLGMTGKVTLLLTGMDEITRKLQEAAQKPGTDPQLMGYIGAFTAVQLMGQAGTAADGKTTRQYDFEITPEGKLLLNGLDMQAVTKALPASAAPGALPKEPAPAQPQPQAPAPKL